MLQTMAAPLEKLCACTRDVRWRWPHCSWWINRIKHFLEKYLYFFVRPRVCVKLVLQCYWQAYSGLIVNCFMLNCGVVFCHPLYSLAPALTNFFPFPNVELNFRWTFHNVENLKKKVSCELNILPVFAWWLFHATSRSMLQLREITWKQNKKQFSYFMCVFPIA
jgi:hypothetical protein